MATLGDAPDPQSRRPVEANAKGTPSVNGRSTAAEARAILKAIVNYVPIAEMPEPEPAAPEKELISGMPAAQ